MDVGMFIVVYIYIYIYIYIHYFVVVVVVVVKSHYAAIVVISAKGERCF
jgi:hypothetical protein